MFLTDLGSQIFDLDHAFRITDIAVKLQELFRDHREWAALDADDGLVQIRIDPCDGFCNEPLWELLFRLHRDDADAAVIFAQRRAVVRVVQMERIFGRMDFSAKIFDIMR